MSKTKSFLCDARCVLVACVVFRAVCTYFGFSASKKMGTALPHLLDSGRDMTDFSQ